MIMKDAGIEAKREPEPDRGNGMTAGELDASLGIYKGRILATLQEAARTNVIERIWKRDASLWKNEESHQKIIRNSLGWLTVPTEMLAVVDELRGFAQSLRASGEFQHAMVCG